MKNALKKLLVSTLVVMTGILPLNVASAATDSSNPGADPDPAPMVSPTFNAVTVKGLSITGNLGVVPVFAFGSRDAAASYVVGILNDVNALFGPSLSPYTVSQMEDPANVAGVVVANNIFTNHLGSMGYQRREYYGKKYASYTCRREFVFI